MTWKDILAGVVAGLSVPLGVAACAAARPACTVVRAADQACVLFRYTDPVTGQQAEERLDPDDLRSAAMAKRSRKLVAPAASSGGAP